MRSIWIKIILLCVVNLIGFYYIQTRWSKTNNVHRCDKSKDDQHICLCGKNQVKFYRHKGQRCVNGEIVQKSSPPKLTVLRLATKALHQSTRDDNKAAQCTGLIIRRPSTDDKRAYVPLRSVSVEAWIDSFTADVTLTQVFVNQESNPIEAIYVFPIEENAAIYSFTAQIDDRTITAVLKEKKRAEQEYQSAVEKGQTAVLMKQSEETLDTFTINVGALPPGKECRVKIQYVTELELIDGNSIRFVVPTTIAPRYNPSLGYLQSPDQTKTEYVQKTPYSMSFQAHILRGDEYKIMQVANLSHPVNVSASDYLIDVTSEDMALDRDIILDIDLPTNCPMTSGIVEQLTDSSKYAIVLVFTPHISDFMKISNEKYETTPEFIFIVDCSDSMTEVNKIGLAREAMLLFIRSLPVGSHFNIIRFGSHYEIYFKDEILTTVYDEKTAKQAEILTRSMKADFGGTELLQPLKYLKQHPPIKGRSRQVFLLTDGEISNTNEVIELCRSMSSTTRIFSFGLGHSPSRSLVKGLARATNGYFVFVPPNSKVDTYVGKQLSRAFQPSLINVRLEWHGLSTKSLQAPRTIPPLYINDRVLVYQLIEDQQLTKLDITVDLLINQHKITSIKISNHITHKRDTIRRLAAKALIQELQHEKSNTQEEEDESTREQRIKNLSITYQILSPYTAFVGVETTGPKINTDNLKVRHIPIQIAKGDEHLFGYASPVLKNNYAGNDPSNWGGLMSKVMAFVPDMNAPRFYSHISLNLPLSQHDLPSKTSYNQLVSDRDISFVSHTNTATSSLLSTDPVRWLIDQQSFNGAWTIDDKNIEQLTNGKSLSTFQSTVTKNKDVLTTALAIALLESKYFAQKNLWNAIVEKGRKNLHSYGFNETQINTLINEIKMKL